jgi:uncharacterized membrane protein YdjX (TVP38/TMEM64 family)
MRSMRCNSCFLISKKAMLKSNRVGFCTKDYLFMAKKAHSKKKWVMALCAVGFAACVYYVMKDYVSLPWLQQKSSYFKSKVEHNYLLSAAAYMLLYTFLITCALPVIIPLTLIGGFLFGVTYGTLYSTLAAVAGCVISFLGFRYIMRATLMSYFGVGLEKLHASFKRHGMYYLLMLHYSSVVPFFMINAVAALTDMSLQRFICITIAGCLPVCLIYAFAGKQLSTITSIGDIFSPAVIAALMLLVAMAFVPVLIKRLKGPSNQAESE